MRRKIALLYTMLLLVVPLVIILARHGFPEKAGTIPLWTGTVTLILGIIALIGEAYPRIGKKFESDLFSLDKSEAKKESAPEMEKVTRPDQTKQLLGYFALMVGLFIMTWLAGFFLAVPLFVFLSLVIFTHTRWVNALLITLVTETLVFVVFRYLMGFELFQGIFFGDIPPPF